MRLSIFPHGSYFFAGRALTEDVRQTNDWEAIVIVFFYCAVFLIFLYIFITGFHDEGNLIATIIASRSLNVPFIFALAFFSQFFGTALLGTKVARSTVFGLFRIDPILQSPEETSAMISAAMLGAITWNLITWISKIPSSSSHAIVGGMLGPFVMKFGISVINVKGLLLSVLLPLLTSPIIGFIIGYAIFKLNKVVFGGRSVRIKKLFQKVQVSTCILINAFQGSNDAQKGIGVLALLLMALSGSSTFRVSQNVMLLSAFTIALGLVLGGMKMIKSVGTKIYNVKSLHSLSAQLSSLFVITTASVMGFPVSGTQIVNSSIFGVGAADRPNAVGWLYAKDMLTAWLITIPTSFLISAGFYWVFHKIGTGG
ncbi:MAG: inorganic phosphate transporter [Oscillospiraceae bacterium]|jgi:PiT family inorganic phosphate transporter|nr:inorganic phosphate transporter [Oscillospiraceae bacterium]